MMAVVSVSNLITNVCNVTWIRTVEISSKCKKIFVVALMFIACYRFQYKKGFIVMDLQQVPIRKIIVS